MSPRRLALAALLACHPTGPTSPAPAADPGPTTITPVAAPDATTPQLERVPTWEGPPNLLVYPPGPGGWPDLPGRAVGVLWSNALYAGRDECTPLGPDDISTGYSFSSGLVPSYALYFPSDGRGFNFLPRWIVPLPDGTTTRVDAAKFGPTTANPWGLHACAHLVELAVNDGRGGRGLHFIATRARVLDGTDAFPWQLDAVLADLRARFLARAGEQPAALEFSRPAPGTPVDEHTPGMYMTWLPGPRQLIVLLWRSSTRTTTRVVSRETVKPEPCPPGSPCARRDVGTFEEREFQRETVDFAVRFDLDATARVVHETVYAPRHRMDDGHARVQVHN